MTLTEEQYGKYIGERNDNKSMYEALNKALEVTSDIADSENLYIFAYLGVAVDDDNNFTSSHVFASHIINLNTTLRYAILI